MRLALTFALLAACDEAAPRDVRLDLLTRPSCGAPVLYETDCIGSLEVRLVDAAGGVLESACSNVSDDYRSLIDLVATTEVISVLAGIEPKSGVRVEVRAYNTLGIEPCRELSEQRLMLWGSSAVIDLTDSGVEVITVPLECRPDCDCLELQTGNPTCPLELEPGVCGPTNRDFACQKPCDDDGDCYEGLLACGISEERVCGPRDSGGVCDACTTGSECLDDGLCVRRVESDGLVQIDETMCALRCPPLVGSKSCPPQMTCRRIDGTRYDEL